MGWILTAFLVAQVSPSAASAAHLSGAAGAKTEVSPPKVPKGFPACRQGMRVDDIPRTLGETIRYMVDVNGMSLGSIDFRVEREGNLEGEAVTEYRSLFRLDAAVSSIFKVRGQAATLIPRSRAAPVKAMNRYVLKDNRFEEDLSFGEGSFHVESLRKKNGKIKEAKRVFAEPVHDFISGFYMMRSLPREASGCVIIYGNQRAYTVWFEHDGQDDVETPVGYRKADRYRVRYVHEKARKPLSGLIWIGDDSARLPYRLTLNGKQTLDARIHTYQIQGQ